MVHIFSGKVFCLECSKYLRKKNSSRYQYLVCSSNQEGYDDCINKYSIRYDFLEDIVLNAINEKLTKFYDEETLKQEGSKNNLYHFSEKIKILLN